MGKLSRGRKEWFQPRKHHHYIPKEFQTPTNSDSWLISHYVMQLVPLLLPRPSRLASLASITQFCVHWQRQAPHNITDEGRTLQYAHPLPFVHPQSIPNPTHSTHAWSLRLGSYRCTGCPGCRVQSHADYVMWWLPFPTALALSPVCSSIQPKQRAVGDKIFLLWTAQWVRKSLQEIT